MQLTIQPARGNPYLPALIWLFCLAGVACAQKSIPKEIPTSDWTGSTLPFEVKGKVFAAKSWIEGEDSNVVVFSQEEKGEQCENGYINRLHAYRASKHSGQWHRNWAIKDFGPGSCYMPRLQDNSFHVFDVDGKGPFETLFFYSMAQDGAAPFTLKMIFHWNGTKLPIRGKIPLTPEDSDAYEAHPDSQFSKSPPEALAFAQAYWKEYIASKFRNVKQP